MSARVIVTDSVSMFEPTVSWVVEGISGESLSMKLLLAPLSIFQINERDVVFAVRAVQSDWENKPSLAPPPFHPFWGTECCDEVCHSLDACAALWVYMLWWTVVWSMHMVWVCRCVCVCVCVCVCGSNRKWNNYKLCSEMQMQRSSC